MLLHYIYYKLYRASEKSSLRDIPEFVAPVFLGGLISANLLVTNALLAKLHRVPFLFSSSRLGGLFAFSLIVLTMAVYRKSRYEPLLKRYSKESNGERIRGNITMAVYVAVSFLSIFAVGLFKPGKL